MRTRLTTLLSVALLCCLTAGSLSADPPGTSLDDVLNQENADRGASLNALPVVDDLTYLRRVSIDLIGRIPTVEEVREFQSWPAASRRQKLVDKLLTDIRFTDRWTVFFADMLRLRSNVEGGNQLVAYVHKAVEENRPYDELARRLIVTNGKVGTHPEVGFILGDNADPMALAGAVSQTFMGIRISCAQCHDHPFDVWTRKDFYDFAAYFGKTRRQENRFDNRILAVYTTDVKDNTIMWPPEGVSEDEAREQVTPRFPFELASAEDAAAYTARLKALREQQAIAAGEKKKPSQEESIDNLLAGAEDAIDDITGEKPKDVLGVNEQLQKDVNQLDLKGSRYRDSQLRVELANYITNPRNRYFSRSFTNRVWSELMGRGIVDPIDDFSFENEPSHPETLDYLADEFVANGYDLRFLIRTIVTSEAYQREQAINVSANVREELESNFLAAPMRRMISEVLYDSIIIAGHLFEVKHEAGKNLTTQWRASRVMIPGSDRKNQVTPQQIQPQQLGTPAGQPQMAMNKPGKKPETGYNLEQSIDSLDFNALLKKDAGAPKVDAMRVMSAEELEAMRMAAEMRQQQADYYDRFTKVVFDDNPKFTTALRMASPAPPEHFLRIFGQTGRTELGMVRDETPTTRQALMLLNGRLTHEASRVGELEPIHKLLVGKQANLEEAIKLAYLEILTRKPTSEELADAKFIIEESKDNQAGMADLRWVLLNCNEFRFLP